MSSRPMLVATAAMMILASVALSTLAGDSRWPAAPDQGGSPGQSAPSDTGAWRQADSLMAPRAGSDSLGAVPAAVPASAPAPAAGEAASAAAAPAKAPQDSSARAADDRADRGGDLKDGLRIWVRAVKIILNVALDLIERGLDARVPSGALR